LHLFPYTFPTLRDLPPSRGILTDLVLQFNKPGEHLSRIKHHPQETVRREMLECIIQVQSRYVVWMMPDLCAWKDPHLAASPHE
jgi:hypothetical protein